MHLTALETRQLSNVFATLSQPETSAVLRQRLIDPLVSLLGADYVASLVWDESKQSFAEGVSCVSDKPLIEAYQAHYQFSDPLAAALRVRRYPTLVTQVIPQRELVATEFFNRFLHPGKMYWGLNIFVHDGRRDVGDFRIWRSRARGNFNAHSLEVLRLIYPSLVNALSAARPVEPLMPSDPAHNAVAPLVGWRATRTLDQQLAYQHGLSRREFQIARLIAQGLADKEIAKAAGIGFTTVRTYLEQTLKKTGCANRKELIAYLCSH